MGPLQLADTSYRKLLQCIYLPFKSTDFLADPDAVAPVLLGFLGHHRLAKPPVVDGTVVMPSEKKSGFETSFSPIVPSSAPPSAPAPWPP